MPRREDKRGKVWANGVAKAKMERNDRVLLMGLRRSGKSSILNVLLYKVAPSDTVFIPATVAIKKHLLASFRDFDMWDLPGQIDYLHPDFDTGSIFAEAGAMAWVLDAQDNYVESISRLCETVLTLQTTYPHIKITVFIHKTDSISSDYRAETVRDIKHRIHDQLNDIGLENPPIAFHATSVYDQSIFEAMSKVMQQLLPQRDSFEALVNNIAVNCKFQKLYLFDNRTKLYFASDTTPVDMASYNVCQDYFDTIMDVADLYAYDRKAGATAAGGGQQGESSQAAASASASGSEGTVAQQAHSFIGGLRGACFYVQEINPSLSLIGWSRDPNFAASKSLVDYNVLLFTEAVKEVLARTEKRSEA